MVRTNKYDAECLPGSGFDGVLDTRWT